MRTRLALASATHVVPVSRSRPAILGRDDCGERIAEAAQFCLYLLQPEAYVHVTGHEPPNTSSAKFR
jgi:hypothetical protein